MGGCQCAIAQATVNIVRGELYVIFVTYYYVDAYVAIY